MDIDPDQKFVIVSNKHSGNWPGCLLFWGQLTSDGGRRSFGGYTTGIDKCERYSEDDIVSWGGPIVFYHPGMSYGKFLRYEDVAIEPKDLRNLGLSTLRVWYKP